LGGDVGAVLRGALPLQDLSFHLLYGRRRGHSNQLRGRRWRSVALLRRLPLLLRLSLLRLLFLLLIFLRLFLLRLLFLLLRRLLLLWCWVGLLGSRRRQCRVGVGSSGWGGLC
jgi:hypothetical protein